MREQCETANAATQRILKSESKFAPLVLKLDFIFQAAIIYKPFSQRSIWQSGDQQTISRIHPISFIIFFLFLIKVRVQYTWSIVHRDPFVFGNLLPFLGLAKVTESHNHLTQIVRLSVRYDDVHP